ncbi:MAG: thymidine phosphorylase, partial [Acidobacteria bacterium]|nr:thymidine phosphorylase [Acidobacteriota bacterium]
WVHRFSRGLVPDYQVSAFLMAVYFRGMSGPETVALTEAMQTSGALLDLTDLPGRKVDKHSTGGVGDKTSLVVAPAVAAGGLTVPMISGRALAHTGGTLDKLESIPGFQVRLGRERFKEILRDIGVALIGQTDDLVPADRKLYALRDVTATVDSLPLIASSIMSKKLAEGIDGLVLDVKTGSGAFARSGEQAEALARAMVEIGNACRCRTVALITGMDQPLGECVGNSLEVEECVEVLRGRGPEDLRRLCEELAAHCFRVGQAVTGLDAGRELYRKMIAEGRALDKFREVVRLQGGDPAVLDDCSGCPRPGTVARFRLPARVFSGRWTRRRSAGPSAGSAPAETPSIPPSTTPRACACTRKRAIPSRPESRSAPCTITVKSAALPRAGSCRKRSRSPMNRCRCRLSFAG